MEYDTLKYKQGDLAYWEFSGSRENVTVVGVANTGITTLGVGYIVELESPLPDYPYTHIVAYDVNLTPRS